MTQSPNRALPKLAIFVGLLLVAVLAGEILLELIVEGVDLLVEVSQWIFMQLYYRALHMPYEKALGQSAWSGVGLLILLALILVWKLIPVAKRECQELIAFYCDAKSGMRKRWSAAKWYHKFLLVAGGVASLLGLLMVI